MRHVVTVIPGDGIGPEVVEAARRVIEATRLDVRWIEAQAGESALETQGSPLPVQTMEAIRNTGVALKGPCGTPVGTGFKSVNVALRQEFDLFANLRPIRSFPGVKCLYPDLDLVIVRENTGGLYSSMEHWIGPDRQAAMGIGVNTRSAMERICRFAYDYARTHKRKRVTVAHKANILKIFSGLLLEVARDLADDYPDLTVNDLIVDNMAMQLVMNPRQFDVIVTTNLFGDILSDLAAGLVGGLGLAPGANLGDKAAIFEAVHGTAPDLAGKNAANPTSVILAGSMMLDHLGHPEEAATVMRAVRDVLAEGTQVTRDLNPEGGVSTSAMTDAIVRRIESLR